MNADERIQLALLTRDQGLADLLTARDCIGRVALTFITTVGRSDAAHAAVSKSQQSSEKILKGYFLFHQQSFNPFRGHNPLTQVLGVVGNDTSFLRKFRQAVRQQPGGILNAILRLEGMVPSPPSTHNLEQLGLNQFSINTEYAFWDAQSGSLTLPAVHFRLNHALQFVRVVTSLCKIITAEETNDIYEQGLRRFLEDYPLNSLPTS